MRIYANGKQIAVHKRSFKTGGYTTVKEHLCSHHQHYLDRSPGYYMKKAQKQSEPLYRIMHRMFQQGQYPELLYRSCDGLLSLLRKTEKQELDRACDIALEHDYCNYGFIKNIIKNKMTKPSEGTNEKSLPAHQNVRGAACFK